MSVLIQFGQIMFSVVRITACQRKINIRYPKNNNKANRKLLTEGMKTLTLLTEIEVPMSLTAGRVI